MSLFVLPPPPDPPFMFIVIWLLKYFIFCLLFIKDSGYGNNGSPDGWMFFSRSDLEMFTAFSRSVKFSGLCRSGSDSSEMFFMSLIRASYNPLLDSSSRCLYHSITLADPNWWTSPWWCQRAITGTWCLRRLIPAEMKFTSELSCVDLKRTICKNSFNNFMDYNRPI